VSAGGKPGGGAIGDQSEFTEYSEFENDGDYVVTEMHVVTTPRSRGAARGGVFSRHDDEESGSIGGGSDESGSGGSGGGISGGGGDAVDDRRRMAARSRLSLPNLQMTAAAAAAAKENAADIVAAAGDRPGQGIKDGRGGGRAGRALSFGPAEDEEVLTTSGINLAPIATAVGQTPKGGTPSWGMLPPTHGGPVALDGGGGSKLAAASDPADRAVARALKESFHSAADSSLVRVSATAFSGGGEGGGGSAGVHYAQTGRSGSGGAKRKSEEKDAERGIPGSSPGGVGEGDASVKHAFKGSSSQGHGHGSKAATVEAVASNHGAGAGSTTHSSEYSYGRVLAPEDELTSECEEVCLMIQHPESLTLNP
jgi:hypothetical protein